MYVLKKIYNSRYFAFGLFGLYAVILMFIYADYYISDMSIVAGDGINFFLSRIFTANMMKKGEIPLWNPYLSNGIPWAADFCGVFYPLQWLLLVMGEKDFIYFYYIFHVALGATFTYLYLKETGIRKIVAIVVSIIYLCSIHIGGYRKSHIVLIVAMVFLPVILYFVQKYLNTLNIKWMIISSIMMALAFYSGAHIQYLVYIDLAVGIYFLAMLLYKRINFKDIFLTLLKWTGIYAGLIALQLIPAVQLLSYYKSLGAEETSYEYFSSFSMHPVKLIMMVFPEIFGGDILQPMGMAYSSEMDIEIFLGAVLFFVAVWYVCSIKKDIYSWIYIIFISSSFMFAACAHIPLVGKVLFHLPLIGSFRVPSRIIFIYIFFLICLFAKAVNSLLCRVEQGDMPALSHFNKYLANIIKVIFGLLGICIIYALITEYKVGEGYVANISNLTGIMKKTIIAVCIMFFAGKMVEAIIRKETLRKTAGKILLMTILSITLWETGHYSIQTQSAAMQAVTADSAILDKLSAERGTGKVMVANPYIDATYPSIIEQNRNIAKDLPALNAYISLNNPRLFKLISSSTSKEPLYNSSGLYTGFEHIRYNLLCDNDILSMLGVKYIIDRENYIDVNGSIINGMKDKQSVYNIDEIYVSADGNLNVVGDYISLKNDTYYKIRAKITALEEQKVYFDFYSGNSYDYTEQEQHLTLKAGESEYEVLIYSGECEGIDDILWRFVSTPDTDIILRDIEIVEQEIDWLDSVYLPYYNDGETIIYQNENAKELIYASDSVLEIENEEWIYRDRGNIPLDKVSCVPGLESFECQETTVLDIKQTANTASAAVICKGDTFINFSQNFYPGWNVYVDGNKVKNYVVNGLIQGTKLSAGEHHVEFKFQPISVYAGGIISLITLSIAVILLSKRKATK